MLICQFLDWKRRRKRRRMNKKCFEKNLGEAITALSTSFDDELFNKKQSELEEYWHFKFNPKLSLEDNLYGFWDLLNLYSGFCERWESNFGGYPCIVERVRDKYVMPKIRQFIKDIKEVKQ
jgi:hypothetical protein